MNKPSQRREAQFQQLINDIAEDENMKRWSRQDLIDCINYQQDQITQMCSQTSLTRVRAIAKMVEAVTLLSQP